MNIKQKNTSNENINKNYTTLKNKSNMIIQNKINKKKT